MNILMNQKRIPADRVKWENRLDKPKKWGQELQFKAKLHLCRVPQRRRA